MHLPLWTDRQGAVVMTQTFDVVPEHLGWWGMGQVTRTWSVLARQGHEAVARSTVHPARHSDEPSDRYVAGACNTIGAKPT